ncbi:ArsR/SmtB family transcription factor [Sulfuriroseicoccus oceanibius]|uniref:Winged helix-turn-helix transcriptional regulator n=1 Tax=Sulfuriroseicoccus oceanibius TaxID=2707525 RepID=A0A7T7JCS9_9BACT|nr:metalloregulator ArsR/SmtB family transcription factor [Sulfuriroseicoccus oceanibius]QQL45642.1 winged helix-turn-helix transcriptional regulator [Sulfuriroseicoccus oceanibius]
MTQDQLEDIKQQFGNNQAVCEQVVGLFHILSSKVRFRTVCMLMYGEASVQEIAEVVTEGKMTNISQQLRVLRLAGVVQQRRLKKQVLYSLADPKIAHTIEYLRGEYMTSCNQPQ